MLEPFTSPLQRAAGENETSPPKIDIFIGWTPKAQSAPTVPADQSPVPKPSDTKGQDTTNAGTKVADQAAAGMSSAVSSSSPGIDYFIGWSKPDRSRAAGPSDRIQDNPVKNGVLEIRYGDPDFDRKLNCGIDFQVLRITNMPAEVQLRHWADDNGYFLWFPNGGDKQARHYYPRGLKVIEIDGQRQDVDQQRLQVSDAVIAKQRGTSDGFGSFDRNSNVMTYFQGMSQVSGKALALQEKILREGAESSKNPYFNLYLSDVLVAQAMQPIIQQAQSGNRIQVDNPETLRKLDEAIEQAKLAEKRSYDGLYAQNRFPAGNVIMPLSPLTFYNNPFGFWGGSYQQAQRREVALTWIKGLIKSGALSNIELPH